MANGQGHLRQRSNRSWTLTIYLGKDARGKPRQLTKTVRGTKKEAQRELARLIVERDRGIDINPERVTVAELSTQWIAAVTPDLASSTAVSYEGLLRLHVIPVIGSTRLSALKPLHIENVKAGVVHGGGSTKLALNVFRVLNAMLTQAVRWQLISVNPCSAVNAPRPRRFEAHVPGEEALQRLFEVANGTAYGVLVRIAALTGARQGELLRLQWRDVDWEHECLAVRGTKTRGSQRTVDLGPAAVALLRQHRAAEHEKRLKLGPGATCGADDVTIFTNAIGGAIDASGLRRTWRRIVRAAGLGHVRFHDLRHASATYLLRAGVPIPVVAQRLGHTHTSTTTDVYGHVLPGMGRDAAAVLEEQMVNRWSNAQGVSR